MQDLYMILMLAGFFALFLGFAAWCDKAVGEPEGDRP